MGTAQNQSWGGMSHWINEIQRLRKKEEKWFGPPRSKFLRVIATPPPEYKWMNIWRASCWLQTHGNLQLYGSVGVQVIRTGWEGHFETSIESFRRVRLGEEARDRFVGRRRHVRHSRHVNPARHRHSFGCVDQRFEHIWSQIAGLESMKLIKDSKVWQSMDKNTQRWLQTLTLS